MTTAKAGALENPDELEAALWLHYRVDLRDLWRSGGGGSHLTDRRLLALASNLPPTA